MDTNKGYSCLSESTLNQSTPNPFTDEGNNEEANVEANVENNMVSKNHTAVVKKVNKEKNNNFYPNNPKRLLKQLNNKVTVKITRQEEVEKEKIKNNDLLMGESLGILETYITLLSKNSNSHKMGLHYLFSFNGDRLYCNCLDFNMYIFWEISDIIECLGEEITKKTMSNVIGEVTVELTSAVISRIKELNKYIKKEDENFIWASHECFWNEYIKIRCEMEDFHLKKFFNKTKSSKILWENDTIVDKLSALKKDMRANSKRISPSTNATLFLNYEMFDKKINEYLA